MSKKTVAGRKIKLIEEDDNIYQWTSPEGRTKEERDTTMKELIQMLDNND